MKPSEIITLAAALIALFWTIVQIVAHARDKDSKNIKIAAVIFILLLGAWAYFFVFQKNVIPAVPVLQESPVPLPKESRDLPPAVIKAANLNASFIVNISRNVIGGVADISMDCIFSETGGVGLEIVAYRVDISWNDKGETVDRYFDKTLQKRIYLDPNSTLKEKFILDNDVGDAVFKARRSKDSGKISVIWSCIDRNGNSITAVSDGAIPR